MPLTAGWVSATLPPAALIEQRIQGFFRGF
jgi:hypothetical protein